MPLKIGLLTGEYPPMEGGVGSFTQELARALSAAGHEIHIITSREARPPDAPRRLWDFREPIDIEFAQLHSRMRRWWWSTMGEVAAIAARYELDILNLQYQASAFDMRVPAVNFLPWRLRDITQTIVTFHDLRVPYLFPKAGPLRKWVVHHLGRSAEGVIVTNPADFQAVSAAGVADQRLAEIPIGSNINARKPEEEEITAVRARLGLAPDDRLLGYFGFLNASKGADTLLHSLAQLDRQTRLVFIGGQMGSSDTANNQAFLNNLQALIRQLDLESRVHWSGFLPDEAVSAYLHAVDLMVMPYRDGVSLRRGTLMAALAHGRPVVTTRSIEPVPQLAHGQNVWLTPVDDPAALGEAIQTLLADDARRTQLGQAAAQLAGHFSWDKIAGQTAAFYESILAKG